MRVGTEWLVDASGCDPAALAVVPPARALLERVIRELSLQVVGEGRWHAFPASPSGPGGVTGLYLLTESHLAVHTYPESRTATFNLYCCRPRARFPWEEALRLTLGAAHVVVVEQARGGRP